VSISKYSIQILGMQIKKSPEFIVRIQGNVLIKK